METPGKRARGCGMCVVPPHAHLQCTDARGVLASAPSNITKLSHCFSTLAGTGTSPCTPLLAARTRCTPQHSLFLLLQCPPPSPPRARMYVGLLPAHNFLQRLQPHEVQENTFAS